MRNSQSTQVTSMTKTVEKMAATNESLVKKPATAEANIKGAEGTADRAARSVMELERKFDKLKMRRQRRDEGDTGAAGRNRSR